MKMPVCVGIDLGGKFHQVHVSEADGKAVGRSFRIGRGRRGLSELSTELRGRVGDSVDVLYTVEATQNYWLELVHPLVREGSAVYLVSPSKSSALRTFYRRHTKTDAIDAAAVARMPTVDRSLRQVVLGDARYDTLRRLVRDYWRVKTQMANRKRRIMTRVLMVYPGYEEVFRNRYCAASLLFCQRYLNPVKARRLGRRRLGDVLRRRAHGKFDERRLQQLWEVIANAPELEIDYDDLQFVVNEDLNLLGAEDRSRQALRERIAEVYTEIDPDTRLQSLPGLGEFLAAAITAFIGDPQRALSAKQAVALSGLHPRQKSSGGTDTPNQRLTRHGDPTLRSCLYVAAEIMRQYDPELRAYYQRMVSRGKHHKKAICALAAKILRRCVAILRERRAYEQVGHQEVLAAKAKGKTVRQSVSEVAERLKDDKDQLFPHRQPYAVATIGARSSKGPGG